MRTVVSERHFITCVLLTSYAPICFSPAIARQRSYVCGAGFLFAVARLKATHPAVGVRKCANYELWLVSKTRAECPERYSHFCLCLCHLINPRKALYTQSLGCSRTMPLNSGSSISFQYLLTIDFFFKLVQLPLLNISFPNYLGVCHSNLCGCPMCTVIIVYIFIVKALFVDII